MKTAIINFFFLVYLLINVSAANAENGYEMWLRYRPVEDNVYNEYANYCTGIYQAGKGSILSNSVEELFQGIKKMLDLEPKIISYQEIETGSNVIIIGTIDNLPEGIKQLAKYNYPSGSAEGFLIRILNGNLLITSESQAGLLYGTFYFLRAMQMGIPISMIVTTESPKINLRLLNHWDNPGNIPSGRTSVERGYGGASIFNWDILPEIYPRLVDYARILASVGINGSVINNVNTAKNGLEGWKLLTAEYLPKLKAMADVFRGYGIRLYISVNFASPILISGLSSADPLDPAVIDWWAHKANEIYGEIPDFGGFLIKADSEGEPGPNSYGRTQTEGENMIAKALEPHGGILMWRAFIYGQEENLSTDRAFQAHQVFKPLDGMFADNSLVQIKNGPIDFQVREPVSPLFGAMPKTNQMLELQITQEYTGQDMHVCYLVPQWKEILDFDTHAKGPGSKVASIIDGSLFGNKLSGIAGVSNIGDSTNWTSHHLAQANLYGFGRLAWDPSLSEEHITNEWISQTFGNDESTFVVLGNILRTSWQTYEEYTSPLGVGMMCNGGSTGPGGHFYPAPSRRTSYHRSNNTGVGYDRTSATGSGYSHQYFEPLNAKYENIETCPDELLLFFHHVPYEHLLKSGKTVIQHIYDTHNEGVEKVWDYYDSWNTLGETIDNERHKHIADRLKAQAYLAAEWRDSINSYFLNLSGIPDNTPRAFEMRGYDIGRLTNIMDVISDAAAHDMNFVTLSHDVCMEWFDVKPVFEVYAAHAKRKGLETYFWNHVIEKPPAEFIVAGSLNLDDDRLWEWLYNIYIDMMEMVPSMTGIVLSFTEAEYQIHRSLFEPDQSQAKIMSSLSPTELIEKTILTIYNALQTKGKKLMVRDFWRTNTEHGYLWDALQRCPKDIMVYTKNLPNDFRYGYPVCMSLGQYPDRIQILEFEPSRPDPEYYKTQMQIARELGVKGVCPRFRPGVSEHRDFFNLAYKKILAHNPDASLNVLWDDSPFSQNDKEAMNNYITCVRGATFVWDSYIGKDLLIQDSRLYKGESRPIYTPDPLTNVYDRRIRGLEGINFADSAYSNLINYSDLCAHWGQHASSATIQQEFNSLSSYAANFAPLVRDYIVANHHLNNPINQASPPLPPDSINLNIVSGNRIDITWKSSCPNTEMFRIERQDNDGIIRQIALVDKNTRHFSDSTLREGSEYSYRIRAYRNLKDMWNSAYSELARATTPGTLGITQPRIHITTPLHTFSYDAKGSHNIITTINDPDSLIFEISLYINNVLYAQQSSHLHVFSDIVYPEGNVMIKVTGTDTQSQMLCSDSINIHIRNHQTSTTDISISKYNTKSWYDSVSKNVHIQSNPNVTARISIYNIHGQQIHSGKTTGDSVIPFGMVNAGLYIVKINDITSKMLVR